MKMDFNKMLFLYTMVIGVVMSISANNLLMMWIGMEISMMSMMPLISNKNFMSSESSVKYFVIQSISSAMMMLGVLLLLTNSKIEYQMILTSSMMMKMGVAPMHNWVLEMIESMELSAMFLIFTMMKIAPLNMISFLTFNNSIFILMSLLVGSTMGVNQNSLRKLISYSSIFNMGFILASINMNSIWIMYMSLYSMMLAMIIMMMMKMNISYINQMMLNEQSMNNKMNLWMMMLAMGGMPPMTGFMMKLTVIEMMISNNEFFTSVVMIISSLMVLFYYLKMSFTSIILSSTMMKWKMFLTNKSYSWPTVINMTLMPMIMILKT
uniref:NADH dehydrogenase subunit 2 n=1 Tax=Anaceratagallia venosa TaxID=2172465 RepID=UPI00300134EF|nr:NADH dehydrogenase subunit 2 [Anaceratagallia venosa]